MPAIPYLGGLIHKPSGAPYSVWGSIQAVLWALGLGKRSIDIDVHCTKDGVVVAVHWLLEWYWPDGRKVHGKVGDYTLAELSTMWTKAGKQYKILPITDLMAASRGKVVLCLEAKPDQRLEAVEVWQQVKADAARHGARVLVMTIQRFGKNPLGWEAKAVRRLRAASEAGLPVMVLSRAMLSPTAWGFVDAWKGARLHGKSLPQRVKHVGPGSVWGWTEHPKVRVPRLATQPAPKPKPKPTPVTYPAPSPPYIPARHTSAGANKPITRIVIHSTVSPSKAGSARRTAAYFQMERAGGSAHYVVDAAETLQCVYDGVIAWHAPPNQHSIGVELCDNPSLDVKRWEDADHQAILARSATLVAELCLAYGVPIKRLSVAQVKAGERGICGHVDVSRAFGQSTHWDPGAFPWATWIDQVCAEADRIIKARSKQ